ncbi:hypothetical protein IQ247_23090 [Plectonema cf. radiosum LEGE 06105]|uniref:Uncharacterized protein n=1 Tax=Plectonema cf. radiosum LEGE 06105 TaxID=945769 RepID=A0A8J7FCV2_9CYAN|nr:hypothetical protein [Plectonema radiosum]MBE9215514.1 hypothetical protein [Plectonema cf. radiosum LEGE 06105]
MTEDFLFILLKVIWQDLIQDVAYDSTIQNWQVLQVVIDENKHNKQVNQSLIIALNKCFYSSNKSIAEKCREKLIKKSTFIQYRGAKIYSPPQNDTDIRNLEEKIKFLEKQLKQIGKKHSNNQSLIIFNQVEELVKQSSQSEYKYYPEEKDIDDKLFAEAEKDCDVEFYKTALRDDKNGLRKQLFNSFLIEVESLEQLNRIFNARTYLILKQIRNKF